MRFKLSAIIFFFLIFLFGLFSPAFAQTADAFQLTGTVTDQNGNGIENVAVTATDPGGSTVQFGPSTTAVDGSYLLDVNAGTYDIHFDPASGFNYFVQSNYSVSSNQVLNIQLVPVTHTFTGTLNDANGDPVEGMAMTLQGSSTSSQSVATGADGSFSITVAAGIYTLRGQTGSSVSNIGTDGNISFIADSFDMTTADVTQDVQLPPVVDVTVVTNDANGDPLSNVPVSFSTNASGIYPILVGDSTAYSISQFPRVNSNLPITDANGVVTFKALQGLSFSGNTVCAQYPEVGTKTCNVSNFSTAGGNVTIVFQPQSEVTPTPTPTNTPTPTATPTPANVAPIVDTINVSINPVTLGSSTTTTASFTDANISDTHTALWDWGDGLTSTGTVIEANGAGDVADSHTYFAAGVYTVTLIVTDNQGATGTATTTVTVNVPPQIAGLTDTTINYQDDFIESGSIIDPDSTSWTGTVDYGDGTGVQNLVLTGNDFMLNHTYFAVGVYTVTVAVTDNQGATGVANLTVTVNGPPTINQILGATITEGQIYSENGSFADADSISWTATVDYGEGAGTQVLTLSGNTFVLSNLYEQSGIYNVTVTVTDNQGAIGTKTATVTVVAPTPTPTNTPTPTDTPTPTSVPNEAPVVGAITASVNPIQVNSSTTATASFTDANIADTHTAVFDWGDGMTSPGDVTESNGSGSVSGEHVYMAAGVYEIILTVTDNSNASDSEVYQYISVYNPTPQGLFNGVRKFTTPAGSYTESPGLSGQVMFGITSKYDGTTPTGDVEMDFNAAGFEFEATEITVLIVANGNEATLQGTGEVNGQSGYTFLVTGIDGGQGGDDFIRFQIKDAANTVVFDSQLGAGDTADPTALITAGNVVIH